MTRAIKVHVQGVDEVRELERALGFEIPETSVTQTASEDLMSRLQAHSDRRRAKRERSAELRRPVFDRLLRDPEMQEALASIRADQKYRMEQDNAIPRGLDIPAGQKLMEFDASTNFAIKTAPYDGAFASGAGASVDNTNGGYGLNLQEFGGASSCTVTIGSWFFTPNDNPFQRFAAAIHYDKDWWDDASGYVAHNDFTTTLAVYDGGLVMAQASVAPNWSDGVSWWESHGDHEEGAWVAVETQFNAVAGHSYFCQVGFQASVDADSGVFGFADSTLHMGGYIQDLVIGSLF